MKKVFSIAIASLISLSATPHQTQSALPNLERFHGNDLGIAKLFTSPDPLRTRIDAQQKPIITEEGKCVRVAYEKADYKAIPYSILYEFRENLASGNNLDIVECAETHIPVMVLLAYYLRKTLQELRDDGSAPAQHILNKTIQPNSFYGINVGLAMNDLKQRLPREHNKMLVNALHGCDDLLAREYAIPNNENTRSNSPNWVLESMKHKTRADKKRAHNSYLMPNPLEKSSTLLNLFRGFQELKAQNVESNLMRNPSETNNALSNLFIDASALDAQNTESNLTRNPSAKRNTLSNLIEQGVKMEESIVYNQPSAAPDTIHQSAEAFSGNFELGLVSKHQSEEKFSWNFELGLVSNKSRISTLPKHFQRSATHKIQSRKKFMRKK